MDDLSKDLGADAAAVASAGSIERDAASHVAHTPGPWHIDREEFNDGDGKQIPVVAVGNAYGIADVRHWSGKPENWANAHLIAAAPSYYEAVDQMLAHEHAGGDGWWRGWEMLKAAHVSARAK